jgi:uncharacterized protein
VRGRGLTRASEPDRVASPGAAHGISGAGLGLRRALFDALDSADLSAIDFMEVAPENWMRVGGRLGRRFRSFSERFPMACHGLSLSLGSPAPLDAAFLREVGEFLDRHQVRCYTEHLSYCSDHGHLYDLLPIPFTEEAARYAAARIRETQDILGRQIGIEHVSYYAAPGQVLTELDFLNRVLDEADCGLLLDVNNVYVNSVNAGYDAKAFIDGLPGEHIWYVHIAGHYVEAEDLCIDTHGSDVIDPVWDLLRHAFDRYGPLPTLLERDFNFPPIERLLHEIEQIQVIQDSYGAVRAASWR